MRKIEECLVCGYDKLRTVFDLGKQPLVNNLKSGSEKDKTYPLRVVRCSNCTHEQLTVSVDPDVMFKNYLYKTGISKVHLKYFADFVKSLKMKNKTSEELRVLDIGSNDGSLLAWFKTFGWDTMGVEPSENLAKESSERGLHIINDFYPTKKIDRTFDCITAFNVFAHNDNPIKFLTSMNESLRLGGRIFIQTTMSRLDSYYHEHISYFNPLSMATLARKCGLEIKSIKEVSMHGKSLLFELGRKDVEDVKKLEFMKGLKQEGLVGYGASANGIVLLNYLAIRPEYVVEDNPLKMGKIIPGVDVPIYDSHVLTSDKRDLTIIILAYNLYDEIVAKIKKARPGKDDVFVHPRKGIA